jgi:nitric oxide dioxygenase
MMPVYFVRDPVVTRNDVCIAEAAWKLILTDSSPQYLEHKPKDGDNTVTCITWFYTEFYTRFFDISPLSRQLFATGIHSQGRFLVNMISTMLTQLNHPELFAESMKDLAKRHCERGVRANEYGIVGEVLFWTLHRCLGPAYTLETETAWVKVYCAILSVIVPYVVKYERENGVSMATRHRDYSVLRTYPAQLDAKTQSTCPMHGMNQSNIAQSSEPDTNTNKSLCPMHNMVQTNIAQ